MIYAFDHYELDEELFELRRGGARVAVQPRVLNLLFLLVRDRDRAISRTELLARNWSGMVVTQASLTRAIVQLRRAIGDADQTAILTVRTHGFRFAREVE